MFVVVHEGVPRVGVFLYVVRNQGAGQRLFQLIGYAFLPAGQSAVASHDRACGLEEVVDVFGKRASVVDARRRKATPGNEQQRESAAHAEADHARVAVAAWLVKEPGTAGFDVVEGRSGTGREVADDRAQAAQHSSHVIEVDGEG